MLGFFLLVKRHLPAFLKQKIPERWNHKLPVRLNHKSFRSLIIYCACETGSIVSHEYIFSISHVRAKKKVTADTADEKFEEDDR